MKKIFALILAIAMIASMSVVVFAATDGVAIQTDVAGTENNKVMGGTVLTYGVSQEYLVTIPADQTFVKNGTVTGDKAFKAEATVSASGVKIAGNELFVVSIASDNGWNLVDTNEASSNVAYTAYLGEATTALTNGSAVISLESETAVDGNSGSGALNFYTAGTGQEGNYVDNLTFTVTISVPQVEEPGEEG